VNHRTEIPAGDAGTPHQSAPPDADAPVEFTGHGGVADDNNRRWLTKILDFINPF
jgi:hypothetical protein